VAGADRQIAGLGAALGSGILSGLNLTGTVGASKDLMAVQTGAALVGGFRGLIIAPFSLAGLLVNSHTNQVWAVRVDAAGPDYAPTYPDTFSAGALTFVVQDIPPPHSCLVGTVTVDGSGNVTAWDSLPLGRQTLLPAGVVSYAFEVTVSGLPAGSKEWVYADHSGAVVFLWPATLVCSDPKAGGGAAFVVTALENCQPGKIGFFIEHLGGYGDDYYGDTEVTLTFTRTGVPA
jgi:hypothetical protein